jgi:hypothetical protein
MSWNSEIAVRLLPEVLAALKRSPTKATLVVLGSLIIVETTKDVNQLSKIFRNAINGRQPVQARDIQELFTALLAKLGEESEWAAPFAAAVFEIAKFECTAEREFFARALRALRVEKVDELVASICRGLQKVDTDNQKEQLLSVQKLCVLVRLWPERRADIVGQAPAHISATWPRGGPEWDEVCRTLVDVPKEESSEAQSALPIPTSLKKS